MEKKQYDLQSILSLSTYKDVVGYVLPDSDSFGVDAFALAGKQGQEAVGVSKMVQMFQSLADPTFINLRADWGDSFDGRNAVVSTLSHYAKEKFNSFAVKNNVSKLSHLQFPLRGNLMSADAGLQNIATKTVWADLKKSLEKVLKFSIKEVQSEKDILALVNAAVKDMPQQKTENFASLPSAALLVFNKLLQVQNQVVVERLESTCLLSQTINGHVLSDAEKYLAVVDASCHKYAKNLTKNKEVQTLLQGFDAVSARQIIYAAQVTADMFAMLASDLGAENHKQLDNALRLEICGVLANINDQSYKTTQAYANVSKILTDSLLKALKLPKTKIIENRKEMGIEYVDEVYTDSVEFINGEPNLEKLMFGRTINHAFVLEKQKAIFVGQSKVFDELQPNAEVLQTQSFGVTIIPEPQEEQEEIIEDQPVAGQPTSEEPEVVQTAEESEAEEEIDPSDLPSRLKSTKLQEALEKGAEKNQAAEEVKPVQTPATKSWRELAALERARQNAEMHSKGDDEVAPHKPVKSTKKSTWKTTLADFGLAEEEEKSYLNLMHLGLQEPQPMQKSILSPDLQKLSLQNYNEAAAQEAHNQMMAKLGIAPKKAEEVESLQAEDEPSQTENPEVFDQKVAAPAKSFRTISAYKQKPIARPQPKNQKPESLSLDVIDEECRAFNVPDRLDAMSKTHQQRKVLEEEYNKKSYSSKQKANVHTLPQTPEKVHAKMKNLVKEERRKARKTTQQTELGKFE